MWKIRYTEERSEEDKDPGGYYHNDEYGNHAIIPT